MLSTASSYLYLHLLVIIFCFHGLSSKSQGFTEVHLKPSDYEPVCEYTSKWVNISDLKKAHGQEQGNERILTTVIIGNTMESGGQSVYEISCKDSGPCKGINSTFTSYCSTIRSRVNVVYSEYRTQKVDTVDLGIGCMCMIK